MCAIHGANSRALERTSSAAALAYASLHTLQDDWNEALGQPGPLPVYLHPTAEGHYTAMIAETVVLNQLRWLTDECNAVRS